MPPHFLFRRALEPNQKDAAQGSEPSASAELKYIRWKCACGLNGSEYPRDDTTPREAACIHFHGCDSCDPAGQDSYIYLGSDGKELPIEVVEQALGIEREPASAELKPCPFCAGVAQGLARHVECVKCGARGPLPTSGVNDLHAWNRRADSAEVERLKVELDELREFKREIESEGVVPASICQLLEDTATERDAFRAEVDKLTTERDAILAHQNTHIISDSLFLSCSCDTKTPEVKYHQKGCKYRLIVERDAALKRAEEAENKLKFLTQ